MGFFSCCLSKPATSSGEFHSVVVSSDYKSKGDSRKKINAIAQSSPFGGHASSGVETSTNAPVLFHDASGKLAEAAIMERTSSILTDMQAVHLLSRESVKWRAADHRDQLQLDNLASEDLQPLAMIGEGGYGTVKLCRISQSSLSRSSTATFNPVGIQESPQTTRHKRSVSQGNAARLGYTPRLNAKIRSVGQLAPPSPISMPTYGGMGQANKCKSSGSLATRSLSFSKAVYGKSAAGGGHVPRSPPVSHLQGADGNPSPSSPQLPNGSAVNSPLRQEALNGRPVSPSVCVAGSAENSTHPIPEAAVPAAVAKTVSSSLHTVSVGSVTKALESLSVATEADVPREAATGEGDGVSGCSAAGAEVTGEWQREAGHGCEEAGEMREGDEVWEEGDEPDGEDEEALDEEVHEEHLIVAVKRVPIGAIQERELMQLHRCQPCPFIVRLFGFLDNGTSTCSYVMEWAEGGDLGRLIESLMRRRAEFEDRKQLLMGERSARYYFACLLLALEFMHKQGLLHRDVKPCNMLLTGDGRAKLADLGFTVVLDKNGQTVGCCGTAGYMAPEVWAYGTSMERRGYGVPADLWSAGATLYEMLTGEVPAENPDDMLMKGWQPPPLGTIVSRSLRDLMDRLLAVRPAKRLQTVEQVRHHDWFRGFDWEALESGEMKAPYVPSEHRPGQSVSYDNLPAIGNKRFDHNDSNDLRAFVIEEDEQEGSAQTSGAPRTLFAADLRRDASASAAVTPVKIAPAKEGDSGSGGDDRPAAISAFSAVAQIPFGAESPLMNTSELDSPLALRFTTSPDAIHPRQLSGATSIATNRSVHLPMSPLSGDSSVRPLIATRQLSSGISVGGRPRQGTGSGSGMLNGSMTRDSSHRPGSRTSCGPAHSAVPGSAPSFSAVLQLDSKIVRQRGTVSGHDAGSVRTSLLEAKGLVQRASSAEEMLMGTCIGEWHSSTCAGHPEPLEVHC